MSYDKIEEAKKVLREAGYHCIAIWHTDDIHYYAEDHNYTAIDDTVAIAILKDMESGHDADIGINWDVIGCYFTKFGIEKKPEIS